MLWWSLQQLKSSNADVRIKAVRSLGSGKSRKAVPGLIKILQDENPQVRLAAIEALAAIGHPASAEPLVSALSRSGRNQTSSIAEREMLAGALASVGSSAVRPLIEALESEDKETRRWAAVTLGRIKDPEAVGPLIGKIEDSRSEVRKAAALALGEIGDSRALATLIKALGNRDLETRRAAVEALGGMRAEQASSALVKAVEDSNEAVQIAAINALAKIGGLSAAVCLRAAMSGVRKTVCEAAASALKGMSFSPANAEERAEIAVIRSDFAAASREGRAAIPALIKALGFRDPQMRAQAARVLASLQFPDTVQPLLDALKDHNATVQAAAAHALVSLGEVARPGLEELLSFYDASVVRQAANALGEIRSPESVQALFQMIAANSNVAGEYPDLFDAVTTAADSLGKILASSPAATSRSELEQIAGLPAELRLRGPSPKSVDCSSLHSLASDELMRRT